jgi:hypothetical protein
MNIGKYAVRMTTKVIMPSALILRELLASIVNTCSYLFDNQHIRNWYGSYYNEVILFQFPQKLPKGMFSEILFEIKSTEYV